jgi:hypothetical protein
MSRLIESKKHLENEKVALTRLQKDWLVAQPLNTNRDKVQSDHEGCIPMSLCWVDKWWHSHWISKLLRSHGVCSLSLTQMKGGVPLFGSPQLTENM